LKELEKKDVSADVKEKLQAAENTHNFKLVDAIIEVYDD
jgi:hypothetical protein